MDSTGNAVWMKFPGNPSAPEYDYSRIWSMLADTGSGYYFAARKPYLMIIHTDSSFNSACVYQNLTINISDYTLNTNPLSGVISPVTMTDSIQNTTVYNTSWYRYDACTGIFIDSTTGTGELQSHMLNISPNPAADNISIVIPENTNQSEVTIYNAIGAVVMEQEISGQKQLTLNVENLDAGIYLVRLTSKSYSAFAKLFVSHVLR